MCRWYSKATSQALTRLPSGCSVGQMEDLKMADRDTVPGPSKATESISDAAKFGDTQRAIRAAVPSILSDLAAVIAEFLYAGRVALLLLDEEGRTYIPYSCFHSVAGRLPVDEDEKPDIHIEQNCVPNTAVFKLEFPRSITHVYYYLHETATASYDYDEQYECIARMTDSCGRVLFVWFRYSCGGCGCCNPVSSVVIYVAPTLWGLREVCHDTWRRFDEFQDRPFRAQRAIQNATKKRPRRR